MIIKHNPLSYILLTFILITTSTCEYRSINGQNNNINNPSAGIPETPFVRNIPQAQPFYADANNNMISTPGNYISAPPATVLSCTDALTENVFPLPRCISNRIMSKQSKDTDMFDLTHLEKFKSKRRI